MRNWLASLRLIPATTLLLDILAAGLFLALLAYLGYLGWRSWKSLDELQLKDRFAARNDFLKTTAQILGGVFFLFLLYFTWVTWANAVANQEKNITGLYTEAIQQLGSEKLWVCLGGIYALEHIARDSPKDRGTIMEVLTAYVRNNAPLTAASSTKPAKEKPSISRKEVATKPVEQTGEEQPKPKAEIQAALTVLGRTAIPSAPEGEVRSLNLQATNLAGADLGKANLQKADLGKANLQKAILRKANLQKADLGQANLQKAQLGLANLQEANLGQANLQEADLGEANLQKAILLKANLQKADLWKANLQKAQLGEANLQEADLLGANLQEADLRKANLKGANLKEAKGLTPEQVDGADWDEITHWPEGFTPPQRRDGG